MTTAQAKHQWAATGVSSYPLTHPIVGQGRFFEAFRHFIHLVDGEAEKFAHVFAVIAQWGVGKSRLGYELVSQINGTSRGWWVRGSDGNLGPATLFHDEADREQYLGLYIRYSQVANDYNNVDNWFAYGLYKALRPLARTSFDGSIQGQIAKEASDRLFVSGLDPAKLARALETSENHSDERLYEDQDLATRLCQAAYAYLQSLGIQYVLVVLDELETAAEAATFGLDSTDIKHLDGRAIKLMGKAIKEEDPRRKLPWLRYVALCSPAIGDELREIQSTARRFELVELRSNAFSDVSDFVQALARDNRLGETYPQGLVEAAYAMSAGNFGWFNVVMAGIDERLKDKRARREMDAPTVGALFDELVRVSGRVQKHVLDHHAIDALKLADRSHAAIARDLLYGQLPVPFADLAATVRTGLLASRNEYDEPIATLFRRVEWDDLEAAEALRTSKFTRELDCWRLIGVDQLLDLRQLLSNLGTYAIHETRGERRNDGKHTLLIPLRQADFVQLVSVLYPHPAAEDAARALWRRFLGAEDLVADAATHIGPSVEMISRLDLRHRKQGQTALIFRDPDQNAAHERALATAKGQNERERARQILTGAMRVIDQHWAYDPVSAGLRDDGVPVISTSPRSRGNSGGGLVACDGLKLHPKGRALFAWVRNEADLERLRDRVTSQFSEEGRTPVIAFTASRTLVDLANAAGKADSRSYMLLYQLSSTEEHILHQIGLPSAACQGFRLDGNGFTTAFSGRLQSLVRPLMEEVARWRRDLDSMGRIAWPWRTAGRLKDSEHDMLLRAWRTLVLAPAQPATLAQLDETSGIDVEALKALLSKLGVTPKARAAGYLDGERAGLFSRLDDSAEPMFPEFLVRLLKRLLEGEWSFSYAEREWFWGYTWEGVKPRDVYQEWMSVPRALGFAGQSEPGRPSDVVTPRPRSELRNAVQEANNWLLREYPGLVVQMEGVFGTGRVRELFAPEASAPPGYKTVIARGRLRQCEADLELLDRAESTPPSAVTLRLSAERRLRILENAGWVYDRDQYLALQRDSNVKTLDFDSDEVSLWQRIRRASLFVTFVRQAEQKIRVRTEALDQEMRNAIAPLPGFPVSLFALSLKKIDHILDGAVKPAETPGATEQLQAREPGTLRQSLRDLQVAAATTQLENLAREVGLDLATWAEYPLATNEGHIAAAFRDLKASYEQLRADLNDSRSRLARLTILLYQPPGDFRYPPTLPALDKLAGRPGLIESTLESVRSEDVERLRSEYDATARLGQFQPLMSHAIDLFQESRKALTVLVGQLMTLENAVRDYQGRLLEDARLHRVQRGLEALAQASMTQAPPAVTPKDIEVASSLAAAVKLVQDRMHAGAAEGGKLIGATGLTFDRWCEIVAKLDSTEDPRLEPQEAEALVRRGLVERTYRLGGTAR